MAPMHGAPREPENDMSAFTHWIDTFIAEKGVDLEQTFDVEGASGVNVMPYGIVIEAIKSASPREQAAIKTTIVKIDFVNGDVRHYFRHLAQAIAI